jgi:hypothetical protein
MINPMIKVIDKIKDKFRLIIVTLTLILLVFGLSLAIYHIRSYAIGRSTMATSLIISDFSTYPSASDAIWDDTQFPNGQVHFKVSVRGKTGTIDFFLWQNCPGYVKGTVYTDATLATVCGKAPDYTTSVDRNNLYYDHEFDSIYANAGSFKPVILVRRGNIFMHSTLNVVLKPNVDLWSESNSDINVIPPFNIDGVGYAPANQVVNSIAYNDYVRLNWAVKGAPTGTVCTATSSDNKWVGSKTTTGPATPPYFWMKGGQYFYKLSCITPDSVTNSDQLTLNIPPKVELQASGYDQNGDYKTSALAENGTTTYLGSIPPIIMGAIIHLDGWATGADSCTLTSSPPDLIDLSKSTGTLVRVPLFDNDSVVGISGASTFTMTCKRTVTGSSGNPVVLEGFASVSVITSKGNGAFQGNNRIEAMIFCNNAITTLSGGNNIEFVGAIAAKDFNIDAKSLNVRFYYDFSGDDKVPPGFKYLNIPTPKETGNAGN